MSKMVKLSKRLQTIAGFVPLNGRLADIGSDHALLPVYVAETGRVTFAVAGELNQGPFEAACKQVKEAGMTHIVQARKGDGLEVVAAGEVDTVSIAGMGGALIVHILDAGINKLEAVQRLILQPNVAEDQVRRWLARNEWALVDEALVEEDGKFYEVLVADRQANAGQINLDLYRPRRLNESVMLETEELMQFGPYLTKRAEPELFAKWESELEKLSHIIAGLSKGGTEAAERKKDEFIAHYNRIKEVLACLQTVKPSFS